MDKKCGIEATDSKVLREAAKVLMDVGVLSVGKQQIDLLNAAKAVVLQRLEVGGVSEVEKPKMEQAQILLANAIKEKNFAGLADVAKTMRDYASNTDRALCTIARAVDDPVSRQPRR